MHCQRGGGQTALHLAVVTASENCVQLLLAGGVSPNVVDKVKQRTPLHEAARYNRADAISALIDRGADTVTADNQRMTPLHYAARRGNLDACRALVAAGVSPSFVPSSEKSDYLTPFQMAVEQGKCAVANYFVDECGEDIAQRTLAGKTLLQLAVGQPEMTSLLLAMKSQIAISDALSEELDDAKGPQKQVRKSLAL